MKIHSFAVSIVLSLLGVESAHSQRMMTSCYHQKHDLAAHKTLPFGTHLRVLNPQNGKTATVEIRDRGPFVLGRQLDIACSLAKELGILKAGFAPLEVSVVR